MVANVDSHHHSETTVEHIMFVDIYARESNHSRVSRWCAIISRGPHPGPPTGPKRQGMCPSWGGWLHVGLAEFGV